MVRGILIEKNDDSDDTGHPNRARPGEVADEVLASPAPQGEHRVEIAVEWSSINYKDALALSGRPGVIRTPPLVPGIDLVGTVTASDHPRFAPGDAVVQNGAFLGERLHGGLAERAVVDGEALVPLPAAISARRAAAIGTAGFTAMLSVLALERHGLGPAAGPVLVTGAAGGVGSVAVAILSRLGYEVAASTGRVEEQGDRLRALGAATIVDRQEFADAGKPLQSTRWAGAVDAVGSTTLANVLAQTSWGGVVTACGLAQGADLPTTVMPFILRGVSLVGINSVEAPLAAREEAWTRLARDLDLELLDGLTTEIGLDDAIGLAEDVLAGRVAGRTVVRIRD